MQPVLKTPSAPPPDPSLRIVECEIMGCDAKMALGDCYSFTGGLAITGPLHTKPLQCPQEQHFACSLEHAMLAHMLCLRDHVAPIHVAREKEARANALPIVGGVLNG